MRNSFHQREDICPYPRAVDQRGPQDCAAQSFDGAQAGLRTDFGMRLVIGGCESTQLVERPVAILLTMDFGAAEEEQVHALVRAGPPDGDRPIPIYDLQPIGVHAARMRNCGQMDDRIHSP